MGINSNFKLRTGVSKAVCHCIQQSMQQPCKFIGFVGCKGPRENAAWQQKSTISACSNSALDEQPSVKRMGGAHQKQALKNRSENWQG
uniref:Uncharacterized protein n=1 Tax=Arion vulgaris TaxID=1028688 RepID=A0A0B7AMP5_9EUPU